MIRFVPYEEIEKKKWDNCVHFAVNGLPYAYTWYLDSVCEYWDGLVSGDYKAVMPLTWNRKLGTSYLYQPMLTQQLGVFSQTKLSPQMVTDFLGHIPKHFEHIQINLNVDNESDAPGFESIPRLTHHLDLRADYVDIRKNYSGNLIRNLKRASKHDLQLVGHVKPDDLISLFKENMGKRMTELSPRQYGLMSRLLYEAIHKGIGEVLGVYSSNHLCACIFLIRSHHKIIYLFPAANKEARDKNAMSFFIDQILQQEAGTHQVFDFEGSVIESVSRFYKSFGGTEVPYRQIIRNTMPWYSRIPFQLLKGKERGDER